jgi:small ligand-binding sensory domain FIST
MSSVAILFGAIARAAPDPSRFDGTWTITLSCPNSNGALGYSFEFPAAVKDGVLHAEKGSRGQPGWLQLDGKILDDGSADLYATGLVGAAPFAVGQRPAGTPYGYHLAAQFSVSSATGHRVEGRPCTVVFSRSP